MFTQGIVIFELILLEKHAKYFIYLSLAHQETGREISREREKEREGDLLAVGFCCRNRNRLNSLLISRLKFSDRAPTTLLDQN